MSEVVSPSTKSRKRLLIVLAAVLVLIVALIVGALFVATSKANSQAADYKHAFAAWEAKEKPVLLAATDRLPKNTYVLRNGPQGAAVLADEEDGCTAVATSDKKLNAAGDRLPTLHSNGLFRTISSDYTDAGKRSDRRAKIVRSYVTDASATLAQLKRDCMWNLAYRISGSDAADLFDTADKYLMKEGLSEPGVICSEKDGCVSSIAKEKNAYADLRIKALKSEKKETLSLLQSTRCEKTSYGAACRTLAKNYRTAYKLNLAYDTYVRAARTTVDNAGMDTRLAKIEKFDKTRMVSTRKVVLALDPSLKSDKDVVKFPDWADNFFNVMSGILLSHLDRQRAAIQHL